MRVALLAACVSISVATGARAEVDLPAVMRGPDLDIAVGLAGGVGFSETLDRSTTGPVGGVDLSLLDGAFGLHGAFRLSTEGHGMRFNSVIEISWWYVVMLGVGGGVGIMTEDGGPDLADVVGSMTMLIAVPFPVLRLSEGSCGAIVLMPYVRPGLRFHGADAITGFHEAGLMVKWTSYGF